VPALMPLGQELPARDLARRELLLALTPRLLAVGGQEVGEARLEIAGHVPADGREGVAAGGTRLRQRNLGHLLERGLGEGFVAAVFAGDGGYGNDDETSLDPSTATVGRHITWREYQSESSLSSASWSCHLASRS